eukprot:TRINITY_DN29744_c0_g1_i2.p1 TRINITY_DN29744_c0_g1~~TRINITY_DN29744_c0_g1_i2.p1  ORF type:complete len:116 (+),score=1.57 TRINITY_DN29744_c0_g1_i2:1040-1387(+)
MCDGLETLPTSLPSLFRRYSEIFCLRFLPSCFLQHPSIAPAMRKMSSSLQKGDALPGSAFGGCLQIDGARQPPSKLDTLEVHGTAQFVFFLAREGSERLNCPHHPTCGIKHTKCV